VNVRAEDGSDDAWNGGSEWLWIGSREEGSSKQVRGRPLLTNDDSVP
jgi:hypothetical protein